MTKKDIKQTHGEDTTCDFKEAVERKQPKSWLKILNKTGKLLEIGTRTGNCYMTGSEILFDWKITFYKVSNLIF